MIKFEAPTLEKAMEEATKKFNCSVTELQIEVIQHPKSGLLGVFKKPAIIVAMRKSSMPAEAKEAEPKVNKAPKPKAVKKNFDKSREKSNPPPRAKAQQRPLKRSPEDQGFVSSHSDIIAPTSLVTAQDDYEDIYEEDEYISHETKKTTFQGKEDIRRNIAKEEAKEETIKRVSSDNFDKKVTDNFFQSNLNMEEKIEEIKRDINHLFLQTCFDIDPIAVTKFDEETVLVEFTGTDAALLIGKEGYRYKALSYMLFNWINSKYDLQLRLEIAEFLRNQEEMIRNYLVGVCAQVDRDGRAQTKILDGVLVQIALKELRTHYPEKYVAIRTNRDGLKYVIINSFRSNNG